VGEGVPLKVHLADFSFSSSSYWPISSNTIVVILFLRSWLPLLERGGVMISAFDFRSEGRWVDPQSPTIVLFPYVRIFTPHCLHPSRCINGYRHHTVGDGQASHPGGSSNTLSCFMLQKLG